MSIKDYAGRPETKRQVELSAGLDPDRSPSFELSDLVNDGLNVYRTPLELENFIKANWRKLSILAHKIHGAN